MTLHGERLPLLLPPLLPLPVLILMAGVVAG